MKKKDKKTHCSTLEKYIFLFTGFYLEKNYYIQVQLKNAPSYSAHLLQDIFPIEFYLHFDMVRTFSGSETIENFFSGIAKDEYRNGDPFSFVAKLKSAADFAWKNISSNVYLNVFPSVHDSYISILQRSRRTINYQFICFYRHKRMC